MFSALTKHVANDSYKYWFSIDSTRNSTFWVLQLQNIEKKDENCNPMVGSKNSML